MSNIINFKKTTENSLPEMLREMADEAEQHPEEFHNAILLHSREGHCLEWMSFSTFKVAYIVGLLECLKHDILTGDR